MAEHSCESIVVTCIDFRFQESINDWIEGNLDDDSHDRVALAGGVKDLDTILKQIGISKRLHDIQRAILINHEDCGAYGAEGTSEKHAKDLKSASLRIKELHPDLTITTYYLHLDGTFENID